MHRKPTIGEILLLVQNLSLLSPASAAGDAVLLDGLGDAKARCAPDGSMKAAYIKRDGSAERVVCLKGIGEPFDEIVANSLVALPDGGVVYAARRGSEHFAAWSGGKSVPFVREPRFAVSIPTCDWLAVGEVEDGRMVGIANGRSYGPHTSINFTGEFGGSGDSRRPLAMVCSDQSNPKEFMLVTVANEWTLPARTNWRLSSDGKRIALLDPPYLTIDGQRKKIADGEARIDAKFGPGNSVLASAAATVRNPNPTPSTELHFTGGARVKLPLGATTNIEHAIFSPDGTDFAVVVTERAGSTKTSSVATKSGLRNGSNLRFDEIELLGFVDGDPFYVGTRSNQRATLVCGEWVSAEFEATWLSGNRPPTILRSPDGKHFAADIGKYREPSICLDRKPNPLKGQLEEGSLALADNGSAAAAVLNDGRGNHTLVRVAPGASPVETPIERGRMLTAPLFSPDGTKLAIGYQRGKHAGVLLDGRDACPEPLPSLIHFGWGGSATSDGRMARSSDPRWGGARTLFFSPDSGRLAFFSGEPGAATLHIDGGESGPYNLIGAPRFNEQGAFEFMAVVGDDAVLVQVGQGETKAAAAPAKTEPAAAPQAPVATEGAFRVTAASSTVAEREELGGGILVFTEEGSKPILTRKSGDLVSIEFDGRKLDRGDRFTDLAMSADGTKLAFAMSDDRGASSFFVVGGTRFGGEKAYETVRGGTISKDGAHFAYWKISKEGDSSTVSLMLDQRSVYSFKSSRELRFDERQRMLPPVLSDDGRRVAGFLPRTRNSNDASVLILDGKEVSMTRPASNGERLLAAFAGPNQEFSILIGGSSGSKLWREGKGFSRDFGSLKGAPALNETTGRFAIGAPGLYDSASPDGLDMPAVKGTVTAGPVLSPDGTRIAAAVEETQGSPQRLFVDGRPTAIGRIFCTPAFSRDGRRFIYGYESLDRAPFFSDDALFDRGIGRINIDGEELEVDARPIAVGFSPDGRHAWAITRIQKSSGAQCRLVVNGAAGPAFESVEAVAFSPDGNSFAYLAVEEGRHALVVNHTVAARFAQPAGVKQRMEGELAHGLMARARPVFTGNRTVTMYSFDDSRLNRIEATLEGALPAIPTISDAHARHASKSSGKPAQAIRTSKAPTRTASEEEHAEADQDNADGDTREEGQAKGMPFLGQAEIERLKEKTRDLIDGLDGQHGLENIPLPDAEDILRGFGGARNKPAPKPKALPGKPAKSSDVDRFTGKWKVRGRNETGEAFEDVITVKQNGTLVSDHAVELELEAADFEVRSVGSKLMLFARASGDGVVLDWTIELAGAELSVSLVEKVHTRTQEFKGKANR